MAKWSETHMPQLDGRTALVTGANSGLGLDTARALAEHGARVVMACRSADKAAAAADRIRRSMPSAQLDIRALDLADLASVHALADGLGDLRLDLLINNAGVMAVPYGRTQDGFERQMGTNHLGHFALTGLLLDRLADDGRIVNVASMAHRWTPGIDFEDLHWENRRYRRWQAYGDSKLANLLFSFELSRRLQAAGRQLRCIAAHPGYADTHLQYVAAEQKQSRAEKLLMGAANRIFAQPSHMGALPSLYAATADGIDSGDYIGPDGFQQMRGYPRKVGCRRAARSESRAARLWTLSEELTGVRYAL